MRVLLYLRSLLCVVGFATTSCTSLAPASDVVRERDASLDESAMAPSPRDAEADREDAALDAERIDAMAVNDAEVSGCPPLAARSRRLLSELEISTDTQWTCQTDYEIEGYVLVSAGTLKIDPDVRIFAHEGAFLLVGQNARIEAVGKPEEPIVFTAAKRPGRSGAWRGVFLLGKADTALSNNTTLALPSGDPRARFGGSNDEHTCGTLRYVRIEFAGGRADEYDFPQAALTLAGCGSATRVDSVHVHAATDGIGLVGGKAPLRHVLVSAPSADGIEWSAGYRGFVQFAVVQTFYGGGAALKGSQQLSDPDALPRSSPHFYNVTLIGAPSQGLISQPSAPSGFETGLVLQAGTAIDLANSLFYGFWGGFLDVVGEETAARFPDATQITTSIFADGFAHERPLLPGGGVELGDGSDDDGNFSESDVLRAPRLQNRFVQNLLTLLDPFARPPQKPAFIADSLVEGGPFVETAPAGWEALWEPAFYAGALPEAKSLGDRARDWTCTDRDACWTEFPEE